MSLKTKNIWLDGEMVPWEQAKVHVLTHALHYGTGYFEGIRCYALEDGRSAVFRLDEHIRRFFDSGLILGFPLPFTVDQIKQAVLDIIRVNGLKECYIRPLAFLGLGEMGLYAPDNPVHVTIAAWSWGAYLGEEGIKNGIRAKISSYTRHHVNVMMTKSKVSGNYVNSVLAKAEVKNAGYDEAVMLDTEGYIAEASGENIFMVRGRGVKTTPLTSILPGITRECIVTLARDKGYQVVEERFTRDELYTADEAFFTGTAAEVTPIREVDNRKLGHVCPGPVTSDLQQTFFSVIKGKDRQYARWLTYV
ncbi:MAG: branched chain amino acid aminotransferase [Deltaproteobacteria bacterium GWA2_57_13]|nr:MAG: branched chain amino acid aminotransferase [Deltaproteobacteria bacterium GWA2_57_13]OGQ48612.1 MAG: branched chain amino acid aminotransferase [Deltaproteobacteria bacterium RIFCSPLOWO2_02_FULL_57_26]OGQ76360.1 MAG: branched chain amino acid aminotransferase [Deltaproteobacteria bacterium RIFCSPLOWO2_12_FULL_57_22]